MEEPLLFDDLEVGQRWRSASRTVSGSDVATFAALTGDHNPLHVDEEFARSTPFQRPIVHGLLGLSVMAGLGSLSPWTGAAVFVRIVDWRFVRPIYTGDTVHVETEVLEKRRSGRRRGLVTWKRRLVNQDNEVVQEGTLETLVAAHAPVRAIPR